MTIWNSFHSSYGIKCILQMISFVGTKESRLFNFLYKTKYKPMRITYSTTFIKVSLYVTFAVHVTKGIKIKLNI